LPFEGFTLYVYVCSTAVARCHVEAKAYSANNDQLIRVGYVKLDGLAVWQSSWLGQFPNLRGVNTILVDPFSCRITETKRFDTFASEDNAVQLRGYLSRLSPGSVVVGVTADEPTRYLSPALSTLRELGVNVTDVSRRGAFAFIAQKGYPSKTVLRKAVSEAEASTNQPQFHAIITGILFTVLKITKN